MDTKLQPCLACYFLEPAKAVGESFVVGAFRQIVSYNLDKVSAHVLAVPSPGIIAVT